MKHDKVNGADQDDSLDEGQRRMVEAAKNLLKVEAVHARVHEYDSDCQPELKRM